MRVAVLADTHWKGEDPVPDRVLEIIGDAEVVIHAGDLKCEKVLSNLGKGNKQVLAVRGNNFELDLAGLPDTRVEDLNGYKVGITHDIGDIGRYAAFSRKPEELFGEKVDC